MKTAKIVQPTWETAIRLFSLLFVTTSSFAAEILVPVGSNWKYLDDGPNHGTSWRAAAFDDASWPSVPAQLANRDEEEVTEASTVASPTNQNVTAYFRHTFAVPDPSIYAGLTVNVLRTGRTVVYLNGKEIFRNIVPAEEASDTALESTAHGVSETGFHSANVAMSDLVAGENVLAVEFHRATLTGTGIGFDLELIAATTLTVTRGPYLQIGTPTSVIVRWRTDVATDSRVSYGSSPANLNFAADNLTLTTEHIVTVSGLSPDTKYFYSVGTTSGSSVSDPNFFFVTSPSVGTLKPTRIWVLGDSGTANANAANVRNAYLNFTGPRGTDLLLMLGDNAYNTGLDSEYQSAVFNMYPTVLENTVLWPTLGNHDTGQSTNFNDSYPYFSIFTLPKNHEAGGVASGTEHYYSFDYANIHFICLDSMTAGRATNGTMANWLRSDLAATTQDWLIAFWHHPPYTKGSHNSDTESQLVEMRQNFNPILESYGVDLVLCGHSHSYERSYLLNGHYGLSSTLTQSMKVDGGDGRVDGTGAYQKLDGLVTNQGAVYAVPGSSGQISGGTLNHPAMLVSSNVLGSMVLDVNSNRLDAIFLNNAGASQDHFTMIKINATPPAPAAPTSLTATPFSSSEIDLTWTDNASNEDGFKVERSTDGINFTQIATVGANVTNGADIGLNPSTKYYYRVRAFNSGGDSDYSSIANATTLGVPPSPPTGLTATAISSSQINLAWIDNSGNETIFKIERSADGISFAQIATVGANITTFSNTGLSPITSYHYRVRANNSNGDSGYSNPASATTLDVAPAGPSTLTAIAISTNQINLAWADNSANEQGFKIERSPDGTTFTQIATVGANVTSYANVGLNPSTTYFYRVFAFNSVGDSAPSNIASSRTFDPPPAPPGSLFASAGVGQVSLTWGASSGATSYNVKRSTTSGGPYTTIATAITLTGYTDTAVVNGTTYYYVVTAVNGAGESGNSNQASATPQPPPLPAAPTSLTAATISGSQINLAWTDNSNNETGFKIERSPDGTNFSQIATVGANVTTFSNTGLSPATKYYYRVRSNNSSGDSGYSNVANATTLDVAPAAPSNLIATDVSKTQINLAWADNSSNEQGFLIERSIDGATFTQITTVGANVTSYQSTGLQGNKRYYYRVRAYNAIGNSAYSNTANAKTPPK